MPHSTFNTKQVADYLHITPDNIEQLVRSGEIPFEGSPTNPTFLRGAIDAWASQRILGLSEAKLSDYHVGSTKKTFDLSRHNAILPRLIRSRGICHDLPAKTKSSVIGQMVALAETTDHLLDPAGLEKSLIEREDLCTTALAGGVALLHPRHYDAYTFDDSFVVLGRTIQAVPFSAPDGERTDIFFLVCCDDDRLHLHVLARLCLLFYRTDILDTLRQRTSSAEMLEDLFSAEQAVIKGM